MTPRLAALQTLENILGRGQNMNDADRADALPDRRDRALSRHLVYGLNRWLPSLQWIAGQLMDRPLKKRDRDIHRLILMGIHQLWLDSTAPHAAIHETAETARLLGKTWAVGLVNAVLRRFQREQESLLALLDKQAERFAHPKWLLDRLQNDWPDDWQNIARANNQAGPLWLRINRSSPQHANLVSRLENGEFTFTEGLFSVQDPAAQLAVELMDLQPGQRVLDACAAPGGKTCHMLERVKGLDMTALDLGQSRLDRVRENLDRLHLRQGADIRLVAADAGETSEWWDGNPYDRILLDAPCTASGVIRRHPEIKWLRTSSQLENVRQVQEKLLSQLWPLLREGGILVYATCSVLADENRCQIVRFLESHDDAESLGMTVPWGRDQEIGRQILPGELEMDGFFYARLRKTL
jgi:16S rRNA (cytosine967-C5)-methyltransferase